MEVRILWRDGIIACCSQMCSLVCPRWDECELVKIEIIRE